VTVFSGEHGGNLNGVRLESNPNVLLERFDLIVVHGGNVGNQDCVHMNAHIIPSPILYMLILPSTSHACMKGLRDAKYIGCSTQADWDHVKQYNVESKAVRVRHGIVTPCIDNPTTLESQFRAKYNITTKYMFLTCGGFWHHKGMIELADVFTRAITANNRTDITLVCTGYNDNAEYKPKETPYVKSLYLADRDDVTAAMAAADLYIMNSYEEGYGLVLLEAMNQRVPWISRAIAGALQLEDYGITYKSSIGLQQLLQNPEETIQSIDVEKAYQYVVMQHSIARTVDDIESCLQK
jgi:glycosyltransferase involved in cell wall biosynthesis